MRTRIRLKLWKGFSKTNRFCISLYDTVYVYKMCISKSNSKARDLIVSIEWKSLPITSFYKSTHKASSSSLYKRFEKLCRVHFAERNGRIFVLYLIVPTTKLCGLIWLTFGLFDLTVGKNGLYVYTICCWLCGDGRFFLLFIPSYVLFSDFAFGIWLHQYKRIINVGEL